MSFCGHCGHEDARRRRYCAQCGTFRAPVCDACTYDANEVGDKFCGGCGEALVLAKVAASHKGSSRELAGLFALAPAAKKAIELPESNVSQEDIDRLFSKGAS